MPTYRRDLVNKIFDEIEWVANWGAASTFEETLTAKICMMILDPKGSKTKKEEKETQEEDEEPCPHVSYRRDCADCQRGGLRKRPHRRTHRTHDGVLSVDLSGPHRPTLMVDGRMATYFMVWFLALTRLRTKSEC